MFKKLNIRQNRFNDYKFYIEQERKSMNYNVLEYSKSKYKICISSSHKKVLLDLFKSIVSGLYNEDLECEIHKNILLVSGDGLLYFNTKYPNKSIIYENDNEYEIDNEINELEDTENSKKLKYVSIHYDRILEDLNIELMDKKDNSELKDKLLYDLENQLINDYEVDILMYSPTITSGISLNREYYDYGFHYLLTGACSMRENIQMLFRIRILKSKCMYLFLGENYSHYIDKHTLKQIESNVKNELCISNSYKNEKSIYNIEEITNENFNYLDNDYMKLRYINKLECVNSLKLWIQEFFYYMSHIHKFIINENLIFINTPTPNEEITTILKNVKSDRLEKELLSYLDTNITNYDIETHNEIKEKLQSEDHISNSYMKKYKKFNKLHNFLRNEPVIMYFFIKDRLPLIIEELENEDMDSLDSEDMDIYNLLTNDKLIQFLKNKFLEVYEEIVNGEIIVNDYQLHKSNTEIQSKYKMIKDLLNKNVEENYDYNHYHKNKSNMSDLCIINTILKFMKIDNLNKEYKFINECNYKKYKYTGLRNEIFNKENTIKDSNENEINFMDYINNFLLPYLDSKLLDTIKLKNVKKLDISKDKDYIIIQNIIKHYIRKVNLEIRYSTKQYQHKNNILTISQPKNNKILIDRELINKKWIYELKTDNEVIEDLEKYKIEYKPNELKDKDKCILIYINNELENDIIHRTDTRLIIVCNENSIIKNNVYKGNNRSCEYCYYELNGKKLKIYKEEYTNYKHTDWKLEINFNNMWRTDILSNYEKNTKFRYYYKKPVINKLTEYLSKSIINYDKENNEIELEKYDIKFHNELTEKLYEDYIRYMYKNINPLIISNTNEYYYEVFNDIHNQLYNKSINKDKWVKLTNLRKDLDMDTCLIED